MKNRFIKLILIFCLPLSLLGQTWCPKGATWYYSFSEFIITGYYKITYIGDTTINTTSCKILEKTRYAYSYGSNTSDTVVLNHEYVYADANKIYVYRLNKFYTLYDFSANIGDTIIIPGTNKYSSSSCDSIGAVKVDSTGSVLINGKNLRYIVVSPTPTSKWGWSCRIIETIGPFSNSTTQSYNYLFPEKLDFCGMTVDELDEGGSFRCYSDTGFAYTQLGSIPNCDYLPTGIKENYKTAKMDIYPNPAANQVSIGMPVSINSSGTFIITDILGQEIKRQKIIINHHGQKVQFDISNIPQGIYHISFANKDGYLTKSFVKE